MDIEQLHRKISNNLDISQWVKKCNDSKANNAVCCTHHDKIYNFVVYLDDQLHKKNKICRSTFRN